MKLDDMIQSKYLKQSDVPDPLKVTVASLKKVNMAAEDQDPEYKWTVKFEELPKPMSLNTTNLKRMFKYCGPDTDDWPGKHVIVFSDPDIEYKGEVTGGLRIREAKTAPPARALAQGIDKDDIPFN